MAKWDVGQLKAGPWFDGTAEARRQVFVKHEAKIWLINQGQMQAEELPRCELNVVLQVLLATEKKCIMIYICLALGTCICLGVNQLTVVYKSASNMILISIINVHTNFQNV